MNNILLSSFETPSDLRKFFACFPQSSYQQVINEYCYTDKYDYL